MIMIMIIVMILFLVLDIVIVIIMVMAMVMVMVKIIVIFKKSTSLTESFIFQPAGPATCNKFVVAYCSVGYRSSALVDKLINHFESLEDHRWKATLELYNLEGSLFQWANEKRELVTCTGRKTVFAHPYNAVWGKLLDHNLRRNEPEVFDNEAMNAPQAESLVRP